MSLLDIFTGDPAKEAAAKNSALFQQNQNAGAGYLTGNQTAGTSVLNNNLASGTNTLNNGQNLALGSLSDAAGAYDPLKSLATKYGGGTDLYLDSLGVNGAAGNNRAVDAYHAGPGYNYAVNQALEGVNRGAAAAGGAPGGLSGNTLAALSDRAGNLANQEYGNWQTRLAGLVAPELSATSGAASGVAGVDTNKANVYTGTAGNIANLGTLTAQDIANLGTSTAGALTNLGTNTTNSITGQNTQAANAEMAGSGNLWGLGLNLAKLGVGAATGGTSLLGGKGAGSLLMGGGSPSGY